MYTNHGQKFYTFNMVADIIYKGKNQTLERERERERDQIVCDQC